MDDEDHEHRRLIFINMKQILTPEEKQIIQDLALRFSDSEIKRAIERFMQAEEKMRFTSIIQLPLELAVVDVCQKNQ